MAFTGATLLGGVAKFPGYLIFILYVDRLADSHEEYDAGEITSRYVKMLEEDIKSEP
jgi:hypothetical protein